jgi:hypothetical protein
LGVSASEFKPGEILVLLHSNVKGNVYEDFIFSFSIYDFEEVEKISERLNLIHFKFDEKKISEENFLLILKANPNVDIVQLNYININEAAEPSEHENDESLIPTNSFPNDPLFYRQWALHNTGQDVGVWGPGIPGCDIKAIPAWDLIRTTPNRNHRIPVVAVIEDTGNDFLLKGNHKTTWKGVDANNNAVSSGVYFYRIKTNENIGVRKILLVK